LTYKRNFFVEKSQFTLFTSNIDVAILFESKRQGTIMKNFFYNACKVLSLTIIMTLAGQALAENDGKSNKKNEKRHEKMMKGKMKHLEALGLTAEQQEKMKSLHETQREEMTKVRDASRSARSIFGTALDQAKSDGELTGLHETMLNARMSLMRLRFQHMLQMRALLTEEQKKKFHGMFGEGSEED
jgi:Spy/CpxP family protein refolding chaperone